MLPIAIIDPALGRTGAHNQGFAELLTGQVAEPGRLAIWCNRSIDDELLARLGGGGVAITPTFSINFYQIIGKGGGVADHWDWIYHLATEYLLALEQVLGRWPGERVRLLYHTMSWEHATALSLAIGLLGDRRNWLQHLVFLMYSPGVDEAGKVYDVRRRLNFRLAFASLATQQGVDLHAGCSEYAAAYAALLGQAKPLPIHPCFLGDWHVRPECDRSELSDRILLYVGEIKQEKGFLSLPRVVEDLARRAPGQARLIIQFVNVRNEAGKQVLDALAELATRYPQVELHHGFWSDEQLHDAMATTGAFHMNYDAAAYAHKTSGLLWLAAWHQLPVAVPPGTWLEREARRLGLPVIPPGAALSPANAVVDLGAFDESYFRTLFMPFWNWLETDGRQYGGECPNDMGSSVTEATNRVAAEVKVAQSARQHPRTDIRQPGADVVLFWKQNDTTLYGRRCDMVAHYLASRVDVRRVVVLDAPVGEAELARLAQDGDGVRQGRWIYARTLEKLRGAHDTEKLAYRVFTYPSAGFNGNENGGPSPAFLDRYVEFLEGAFAEEQVDPARAVFWIYPRSLAMPRLLEHFRPARVVVDVVDDHRAWPGVSDEEKQCLTLNYRSLLASADIALANCEPVQQAMRGFCPDIRLVPNGCDSNPPQAGADAGSAFDEFRRYPGKTIGYVGNLEAKIDIELLSRVADRFCDCQLVLIGSTHANPRVLELLRYPNVCMPGVVPYDRLGAWLSKFDVGLIPHLEMELTRYMNPLKAYVYLSWGVPVVATAVANVDAVTGLVQIASGHEKFLDQVAQTLDGPRPPPQVFREHVAANDWKSRLSEVVDALGLASLAGPGLGRQSSRIFGSLEGSQ